MPKRLLVSCNITVTLEIVPYYCTGVEERNVRGTEFRNEWTGGGIATELAMHAERRGKYRGGDGGIRET